MKALFLLLCASSALAANPIKKEGASCPSGYSTSGAYCVPHKNAKEAIKKEGASCPSGYSTSSTHYCLANK